MGTTRIKVIDLSSDKKEIKTSRKHARLALASRRSRSLAKRAEKLSGVAKLKGTKGTKGIEEAPEKVTQEEQQVAKQEQVPQPFPMDETSSTSSTSRTSVHRHHLGKLYAQAAALIDKTKAYPPAEALDLLTKTSYVKFDPTVEIHLNVVDKNLRGSLNLPHPVTKKKTKEKKYLIFCDQKPQPKAGRPLDETNTDTQLIFGDDATIEEIAAGTLKPNRDFDKVLATPKFMPALAKIAKILGPVGMMPNPKDNTIIEGDVGKFIDQMPKQDDGKLEYKTDPNAPIIHSVLGKLSDKPQNLSANLKTFVTAVGPTKITKAVITSTMGPGIKIDISAL